MCADRESGMPLRMSETSVLALREALASQQQLLQKLYNELDKEREASSTAASEALSMILRLQGEKAAVKMEAEHYKRLAEEKMCYAEESIQIFEDIMYQKEMEIASLDYQVQAYKYKLLSLGCNDPESGELKFPENLLQRKENLIEETSARNISRRNSAPPVPFKFSYFKNKGVTERERSESPETDMSTLRVVEEHTSEEVSDQNLGSEKQYGVSAIGDKNSYWEQIRLLDEQVNKIAGEEYRKLRSRSRSPSLISQGSSSIMFGDAMKETITIEAEELTHPSNSLVYEGTRNSSYVSVHDVFEVPQTSETISCGECKAKDEGKMILQVSEKCGVPELYANEAIKQCIKDQADSLGEMLLAKNCKPIEVCQPSEGVSVDCHLALVHPTVGYSETQNEVQEFHMPSEIVELTPASRQESNNNRGEDELRLLSSIQEQLNSIQNEIRSLKPKESKKCSLQEDLSMASLQEAMLHFWL
ncbi:hypothetical protein DCAR_0416044 [Daucus carota subsp. sativus]|uniref:GTD-binding domain-containing protein n=2 Tax=Daucus carota subsp. sativus TaxID=79200 RepID=A0AAF0WY82_DAUCS|nr:hypothetical protein DCAR_0416044 [Daucus carota subsp. sativus]